jgi:hypothetical protein
MEAVCERDNLKKALRRVKANKGSPGVDGMTVEQLPDYLRTHWSQHREELLHGTYTPSPVRRVEIPKPDGGVRKLGVPTALDRFVQQAVLQVLQPIFDPTFSDHSYGFRPGRSAHQAVAAAQQPVLVQLLEPLRVIHVRLPSRHLLDIAGIDQHDFEPAGLKDLEHGNPVHTRGLHRDGRDTDGVQPVGERVQVTTEGAERPDRCRVPVRA